jgi:hypothetical protein
VLVMNESIDHYLIRINFFHHLLLIDEVVEDEKKMYEVKKRIYYKIYQDKVILNLKELLFD